MCEFISWIESGYGILTITDKDLNCKEGKKALKETGYDKDAIGHGFIQKFYGIDYVSSSAHKELDLANCNKFQFFKLPKQIKELFKNEYCVENNFTYIMKNCIEYSTLHQMAINSGLPKHIRNVAMEIYVKRKN